MCVSRSASRDFVRRDDWRKREKASSRCASSLGIKINSLLYMYNIIYTTIGREGVAVCSRTDEWMSEFLVSAPSEEDFDKL